MYNPVADSISTIANIPRATGETRALNVNNKMWVMGGGRTAPNPSNEVDIYDPVTGTWSIGTPFVTARRNFPTDTDGSSRIWLAGGYAPTAPTASMEIFGICGTPTPTPQLRRRQLQAQQLRRRQRHLRLRQLLQPRLRLLRRPRLLPTATATAHLRLPRPLRQHLRLLRLPRLHALLRQLHSYSNCNSHSNGYCDRTAAAYTDATASADTAAPTVRPADCSISLRELARRISRVPAKPQSIFPTRHGSQKSPAIPW